MFSSQHRLKKSVLSGLLWKRTGARSEFSGVSNGGRGGRTVKSILMIILYALNTRVQKRKKRKRETIKRKLYSRIESPDGCSWSSNWCGTCVPEPADISGFISNSNAAVACSISRGLKLGSWVWFMGEAGKWAGPLHDKLVEHVSALSGRASRRYMWRTNVLS